VAWLRCRGDWMDKVSTVKSVTCCKIERITRLDFRGTPSAKFQTPEGYFLCECWFEQGKPQIQIRSNAVEVSMMVNGLETMSVIATAIQMAIAWFVEEMAAGGVAPLPGGLDG